MGDPLMHNGLLEHLIALVSKMIVETSPQSLRVQSFNIQLC